MEKADLIESCHILARRLVETQMELDDLKKDQRPKIKLVLTCGACPEQYDAFSDGLQVGYLRLRHGTFRVDYLECGGETIYEAAPKGDGIFDKDERDYYLRFAVDAIQRRMMFGANPRPEAPDVEYEMEGDAEKWAW